LLLIIQLYVNSNSLFGEPKLPRLANTASVQSTYHRVRLEMRWDWRAHGEVDWCLTEFSNDTMHNYGQHIARPEPIDLPCVTA